MAFSDLVAPFRGERYAAADRLSALVAPPYDVISAPQRAAYAADPHNIVHVMLPEATAGGGGDDKYAAAAARLAEWRAAGVLRRDAEPAIYVMAQDFTLPSGGRRTRVGMFAAVAAEGYDSRRIRPHEKTHAGPKADRLALLRATRTNLESIFLLDPDPDGELAQRLRAVVTAPAVATAELDGVAIRLWVVPGERAARLTAHRAPRPLYIADGHHRYETASAFAREVPSADRVLAFIVSAQDAGLAVLPTHRVLYGPGRDRSRLAERWRRWFDVRPLAGTGDRVAELARLGAARTACVVAWHGDDPLALVLRPDATLVNVPELGRTDAVRALDVARIEALVVREFLRAGEATATVEYTADAGEAVRLVEAGPASAAVLLNPTRVEQVFAVADAGDVMPPKSTYFVPKVPSGLVLRPLP